HRASGAGRPPPQAARAARVVRSASAGAADRKTLGPRAGAAQAGSLAHHAARCPALAERAAEEAAVVLAALLLAAAISIDAPPGLPALVPVVRSSAPVQLSPALQASAGVQPLRVLVDLRDQLDFERAAAVMAEAAPSREAQRTWIVRALAAIALRDQGRMRPMLDLLKQRGQLRSWTGVSVVNRLLVEASPAAIQALAADPEVASITAEVEGEGSLDIADPVASAAAGELPCWPLAAIGADKVRQRGIDGHGVTVGLIDSGASQLHEQLRDGFRGGESSWFDPLRHTPAPSDVQLGHGTAVLALPPPPRRRTTRGSLQEPAPPCRPAQSGGMGRSILIPAADPTAAARRSFRSSLLPERTSPWRCLPRRTCTARRAAALFP